MKSNDILLNNYFYKEAIEEIDEIEFMFLIGEENEEKTNFDVSNIFIKFKNNDPYWINLGEIDEDNLLYAYLQVFKDQQKCGYFDLIDSKKLQFVDLKSKDKLYMVYESLFDLKFNSWSQQLFFDSFIAISNFSLLTGKVGLASLYLSSLFTAINFMTSYYSIKTLKNAKRKINSFNEKYDFKRKRGYVNFFAGAYALILGSSIFCAGKTAFEVKDYFKRVPGYVHELLFDKETGPSPKDMFIINQNINNNFNLSEEEKKLLREILPIIEDNPYFNEENWQRDYSTFSDFDIVYYDNSCEHLGVLGSYNYLDNEAKIYPHPLKRNVSDTIIHECCHMLGRFPVFSLTEGMNAVILEEYFGINNSYIIESYYIRMLCEIVGSDAVLYDYTCNKFSTIINRLKRIDSTVDASKFLMDTFGDEINYEKAHIELLNYAIEGYEKGLISFESLNTVREYDEFINCYPDILYEDLDKKYYFNKDYLETLPAWYQKEEQEDIKKIKMIEK